MLIPSRALLSVTLAFFVALSAAACGGGEQPPASTPTVSAAAETAAAETAATATPVITTAVTQTTSPLLAESPLAAPDSPLAPTGDGLILPPATGADGRPLDDVAMIRQIAAASVPPEPQPGMASVSGLLFSTSIGTVIPGTLAYFTQATEVDGKLYAPNGFTGVNLEAGDVPLYSDDYGRISTDNFPPGNYVLAVWTVYDYVIVEDPSTLGYPKIFQIEAGDKVDLGLLELSWP